MSHCVDCRGSFHQTRSGCGSIKERMAIIIGNTLTMKRRSSKIEELPKRALFLFLDIHPNVTPLKRKNDEISAHITSCVSISLLLQDPFPLVQPKTLTNITRNHHNKKSIQNIQNQELGALTSPHSHPPTSAHSFRSDQV
ncbi:hypothetical protein M758_4G243600 [Ceratodon purpureus]|nr:hypothetical protein M758_4G243600 [Ceratodon purpureus]